MVEEHHEAPEAEIQTAKVDLTVVGERSSTVAESPVRSPRSRIAS